MTGAEILSTLFVETVSAFIDIDRVPADIPVVHVPIVIVIAVAVVVVVTIAVVVVVTVVIATVVIPPVPGTISVKIVVVIYHHAAMPITSPRIPAPPSAHHRSDRDTGSERQKAGCHQGAGAIPGSDIGCAVYDRGIVLRNIDDLRVRGLNNNSLRLWLLNRNLRRGL